jgi:hypothetical protein
MEPLTCTRCLRSEQYKQPLTCTRCLRSEQYLALNPEGKMPLLVSDEITLPESDTICRYLLDRFGDTGPSFLPSSAAARAKSDLLCRLHDMYLTTIQGALYKATPPFGIFGSRLDALQELRKQVYGCMLHGRRERLVRCHRMQGVASKLLPLSCSMPLSA